MHGGWDGSKWLSDVYVLDTMSLEWVQLPITGSSPAPRCGHTATMVEKRLLIFGGRGGGGPIMGDLWALKGLFEEENESPAWTQLKLQGQAPAARCGHTVTSGGTQLLVFGGHGIGGWLTRYDVYYNDCIVLDRSSVQWKRLPISNEPPPARAYHTMTRVGSRFFLFGGYDGKSTYGDMWWLVLEDDPLAKHASLGANVNLSTSKAPLQTNHVLQENEKEIKLDYVSPLDELRQKIGLPKVAAPPAMFSVIDISKDSEFLDLATTVTFGDHSKILGQEDLIKALRDYWKNSTSTSIRLRELAPLLRDYHRLICQLQRAHVVEQETHTSCNKLEMKTYRFYHINDAKQLRMADIPILLREYKHLLESSVGHPLLEVETDIDLDKRV
eukprot:TRINITY_DN3104_c0_g1_i4.p1 TRINITY_DN3104_c0_g1~~TRINITY_DN3104_c0_g1_i4.p1  ORF type:complete len:385 (-),score=80.42 TRINITY_DN3104_c0_g1_i4:338-1492(-)